MLYVVTDRRILKLSFGRELSIKAAPADRIGLVQRSEGRDGTGTLSLAIKFGRDSDGDRQIGSFDIGLVADIMGTQVAIERVAAGARSPTAERARSALELPPAPQQSINARSHHDIQH